jgi:transcriptional regulator with XRE-family HTH domain
VTQDSTRLLGEWLQQRREELGISLEQAEVETRIRRRYLEALETDDLDSLPDPFVGRGFLRNYAAYLGLDPITASNRYTQIGAPPVAVPPVDDSAFHAEPFRPVPLHRMPGFRGRRGWVAGLVVVALVGVAFLAWQWAPTIYYWFYGLSPAPQATATNAAVLGTDQVAAAPLVVPDAATPTRTRPAATVTATARPKATLTLTWTPSPSPSPSPPIYTGIFMELNFTGTSWIQVTVDGVRQFQGELTSDTYRSWYGKNRIELRIGNAGAVLVTVNGESLGTLGRSGEVVDRAFERAGEGWAETTPVTPTLRVTSEASPAPTSRPTRPPATVSATSTTSP